MPPPEVPVAAAARAPCPRRRGSPAAHPEARAWPAAACPRLRGPQPRGPGEGAPRVDFREGGDGRPNGGGGRREETHRSRSAVSRAIDAGRARGAGRSRPRK